MKSTARSVLTALLLAPVAIGTVGYLSLGEASGSTGPGVNATPFNASDHWWEDDGCTLVDDRGMAYHPYRERSGGWSQAGAFFSFEHACEHHDGCYRHHWASKGTCDEWFYNDMKASCDALYPRDRARNGVCRTEAWKYYKGVQLFGLPAYRSESIKAPLTYIAY